jgi:hypothetical protein
MSSAPKRKRKSSEKAVAAAAAAAKQENGEPTHNDLDIEGDSESEGEYDPSSQAADSDEGEEVVGSGPAGTISKVVVVNFMNHRHLELDLNAGLNFIIGKNGSGKSAMCHAAQVALGASAKDTERGKSSPGR